MTIQIYNTMKKKGITRVGVVTGNDGFGAAGKKQLESIAPTMGMEIKASEVYDKAATDLTDILTKVKAADVQAVDTSALGARCLTATHYVERIYLGAYVLDTGATRETSGEIKIPVATVDVGTGGKTGGKAEFVTSDGDLQACSDFETDRASPACAGLLKIGLAPL